MSHLFPLASRLRSPRSLWCLMEAWATKYFPTLFLPQRLLHYHSDTAWTSVSCCCCCCCFKDIKSPLALSITVKWVCQNYWHSPVLVPLDQVPFCCEGSHFALGTGYVSLSHLRDTLQSHVTLSLPMGTPYRVLWYVWLIIAFITHTWMRNTLLPFLGNKLLHSSFFQEATLHLGRKLIKV